MVSEQARSLWAKSCDDTGWLSLVQHLEDSGNVAGEIWHRWLPVNVKSLLAKSLGIEDQECCRYVQWLAGTHDIGKATLCFQGQLESVPDQRQLGDTIRKSGLKISGPVPRDDFYYHSAASEVLISGWLEDYVRRPLALSIAAVAGAHHGLPITSSEYERVRILMKSHDNDWLSVQQEILDWAGQRWAISPILQKISTACRRTIPHNVTMVLVGIVVVVDWIASNGCLFPYALSGFSTDKHRLDKGMARLHLPEQWDMALRSTDVADTYRELFGWSCEMNPRPMQSKVMEVVRSFESGPCILVIESKMGDGKTEAALCAADHLASLNNVGGIAVGAPTMATSNALFTRVQEWARHAGLQHPLSMYLAHSKKDLVDGWGDLVQSSWKVGTDARSGEAVVAHQWLNGRKKGMLSSIVVGTVDQILGMALQSRHLMLRHLGLAGKVVVIDEVHAYDAYMSSYLQRALSWLGLYGVPVILLSATLPGGSRTDLIESYCRGAGWDVSSADVPDTHGAYPVLTSASRGRVEVVAVDDARPSTRHRIIDIGENSERLYTLMEKVSRHGGCLLILCNTVARAQEAFRRAVHYVGQDARLLHSNLIAHDRVQLEEELVAELGPHARRGEGRPERRIVVATQVVEQSLDLDFDTIVTDIAPIDLILQRMGRCHRHARPEADRPLYAKEPTTFLRGVRCWSASEVPDIDPVIELIYPRALLLATLDLLAPTIGAGSIELPRRIPELVDAGYKMPYPVPPAWVGNYHDALQDMQNRSHDQQRKSDAFRLPLPEDRRQFSGLWAAGTRIQDDSPAGQAQVRDTDPCIEVVVTQKVGEGRYRPLPWILENGVDIECFYGGLSPGGDIERALSVSTVKLPRRFAVDPDTFERTVEYLERMTDPAWRQSPLLAQQLQLNINEDFCVELDGYLLRYDPVLGMINEGRKGN